MKESLTVPNRFPDLPPALRRLAMAYLLLALAYAVSVPLWEAPDSIWHYHFITHLADGGGLPTRADEGQAASWRQEGSQPPLYYLLTAPLVAPIDRSDEAEIIRFNPHAAVGSHSPGGNLNRMVHGSWESFPWRGTVLAARLVGLAGVLMGLVALLATWAGASALFPRHPNLALATSAVVALNPEFLFFSGAISNDIMITMAGALLFWRWARVLREGATDRNAAWLGVAGGIAMLSKLSGLWLLPPAVLALLWAGNKEPERIHRQATLRSRLTKTVGGSLRPLGIFSITLLLVSGWWYLRNLILFGDPTGLPLMLNIMHARPAPPGPRELGLILVSVWHSYWAVFGWFNLPAPDWVFHLMTGMTLLGLARLAWVLIADRRKRMTRFVAGAEARAQVETTKKTADAPEERGDPGPSAHSGIDEVGRAGLALSLVAVLFMIAAVIAWAQLQYPQGRLALPAAPALGLLLGAGWTLGWSESSVDWVPRIFGLALAGLSLGLLLLVVVPAYRPVPAIFAINDSDSDVQPPYPSPSFGDSLRLKAVTIRDDAGERLRRDASIRVRAGDRLQIKALWEAPRLIERDLSIFLHLLDEHETIIAQRDSFPQSGRFATRDWKRFGLIRGRPIHKINDSHAFMIPMTHATRCDCRLILGVYDTRTGERLPVSDVDSRSGIARRGPDGTSIELNRVRIEPATGVDGTPNPVSIPFGERIELAGYSLDTRAARPSEPISLTLHWKALSTPKGDYKVSIQIRDASGRTIAQRDEEPADGDADTDRWLPGDRIVDGHPLTVYPDAPPGDYRIYIAMYDQEDGTRLPVNWRDVELDLGPFKVLAP